MKYVHISVLVHAYMCVYVRGVVCECVCEYVCGVVMSKCFGATYSQKSLT